ncbi:ParA family protein [Candidatus Sumerlaeota bacterium]|nr:ParA family protein [Candidatus Sumerlaeota bacterium]
MAQIIAINNQKGGVGKTTTCVNLAACFGAAGYRTLLVDMDPQANATSAVGLDPRTIPPTLYHALVGLEEPVPSKLDQRLANLSILPANKDLAGAELEFISLDDRTNRLKTTLEKIKDDYDYILIDSPPSLSLLTLNVLAAADWVIVPVQAEFLALEGLAHVLNIIQRVRQSQNPHLELLGIAITLFDARTRLANEVVKELENTFDGKVFKTKIVRNIRLSEAPSHGKPIIYYDLRSQGAIAYIHLCEEVLHACQKASPR